MEEKIPSPEKVIKKKAEEIALNLDYSKLSHDGGEIPISLNLLEDEKIMKQLKKVLRKRGWEIQYKFNGKKKLDATILFQKP